MPNENNLLPEHAQLAAVLDNPEAIKSIKEPTEKMQIAAVQKKPELVRLFTNTTEKVQLSAVIAFPESVLLMQAPSPLACFTAVERDVQGGPAAHNRYSGRSPEAGIPDEGEQEIRRTGYGSRKGVF
ncbi:hypothetical protein RVY68_14750 [Phocaeicola vulgatus]|uniref:Uncharacterized protein n=1 Tax=Phocaeicola vulgatus TaxID=821 RepID=A0AAE4LFF9_PHOVU|nr:hypothetical protein [Phocaeicola vulgatus]MDU0249904.1 hypothetical protein [Phocaeicola vulgatus]